MEPGQWYILAMCREVVRLSLNVQPAQYFIDLGNRRYCLLYSPRCFDEEYVTGIYLGGFIYIRLSKLPLPQHVNGFSGLKVHFVTFSHSSRCIEACTSRDDAPFECHV